MFVQDSVTRNRLAQQAHLVDMEGYAIARVAQYFGLPVQLIKVVSDNANESAGDIWREAIPLLAEELAAHELVTRHSN